MSDRIDTEAVRAAIDKWQIDTHWWGDPLPSESIAAAVVPALCDEVDRLRAALLIAAQERCLTTDPDEVDWNMERWLKDAAALGEQEAPEQIAAGEGDGQFKATPSPAAPPVERCPTCNSDARWFCNVDGEFHRLDDDPSGQCCTDPWHSDLGADPTTNPEGD